MFKYLNKPLHTYVYVNNSAVSGGEAMMGINIVDVIHKSMKCKALKSLWKYGPVHLVEITIYRKIGEKVC